MLAIPIMLQMEVCNIVSKKILTAFYLLKEQNSITHYALLG
jgi:hypothetical protein